MTERRPRTTPGPGVTFARPSLPIERLEQLLQGLVDLGDRPRLGRRENHLAQVQARDAAGHVAPFEVHEKRTLPGRHPGRPGSAATRASYHCRGGRCASRSGPPTSSGRDERIGRELPSRARRRDRPASCCSSCVRPLQLMRERLGERAALEPGRRRPSRDRSAAATSQPTGFGRNDRVRVLRVERERDVGLAEALEREARRRGRARRSSPGCPPTRCPARSRSNGSPSAGRPASPSRP